MNAHEAHKKIEKLRIEIRRHDKLYYVLDQPEISDKEYDVLMEELERLENQFPQYKSEDSPTSRVGGGIIKGFKTVRHIQKMLSLDNTYSRDELQEWDERVRKGLHGAGDVEYVVELKIDGVSANLLYRRGKLVAGVTRGDGENGEDVTQNIKTIKAIPLVLQGDIVPEEIEIRGEVYMDRVDFQSLNRERERNGDAVFANPRNAASGSLKLLDTEIMRQRHLSFFAHSLGEYSGNTLKTHWEFLSALKDWGIRINPFSRLCGTFRDVLEYCDEFQRKRDSLSYDIDGIVVKVNALSHRAALGVTLKSPRWAVAYKFPARQATTEVLDIKINVGRTGVITPTAELKPVECAGVIIRNATLHNFDEIRRLGVKVGDTVLIERAGDVIPKVVKVVQNKSSRVFEIPGKCPVCGAKIVKEKEEDVAYRCINPSCPAQLERGLVHFASRGAMDIEGMGEQVVKQLVDLRLVRTFADLFFLSADDLSRLELFKQKKISNLLSAIEQSKRRPFSRLLFALGIRHVGEKGAFILSVHFRNMDNLLKARFDDLNNIPEIGPVIAEAVVHYFSLPETKKLVEALRKAGVEMAEKRTFGTVHTPLTGKTVVFTGELSLFTRSKAEELVRLSGGDPVGSVGKNTSFVVAGANPGSKYAKAQKLGVTIIGEDEFAEMVKNIKV
ncbi:MAG: NAD-dependent DNA ligase LigA [Candidatus Omnitrophica bacterium]|nr:NAD-dependent DNA ligase LigA [Candidatus Omnitrophota bacterium]